MIPDFRHDLPLLHAGGTGSGTARYSVGETGVLLFPGPAATADLQSLRLFLVLSLALLPWSLEHCASRGPSRRKKAQAPDGDQDFAELLTTSYIHLVPLRSRIHYQ